LCARCTLPFVDQRVIFWDESTNIYFSVVESTNTTRDRKMIHSHRLVFASCLLLLASCRVSPSYADAAEQARNKLKQEGIEEIVLTPTSDPDDLPLLFQVEGKRGGKSVSGSIEVRYQNETPSVQMNVFEVNTQPAKQ
jgi:hypothetical protein